MLIIKNIMQELQFNITNNTSVHSEFFNKHSILE